MNYFDYQFFDIATLALKVVTIFLIIIGTSTRLLRSKIGFHITQVVTHLFSKKQRLNTSYYGVTGTFSNSLMRDVEDLQTDFFDLSDADEAAYEHEVREFREIQIKAAASEARSNKNSEIPSYSNTWLTA